MKTTTSKIERILSPNRIRNFRFCGKEFTNIKDAVLHNIYSKPDLSYCVEGKPEFEPLNRRPYGMYCIRILNRYYFPGVSAYRIMSPAAMLVTYTALASMMIQNPDLAADVIAYGRDYRYVNHISDNVFGIHMKTKCSRISDQIRKVEYGADLYGKAVRYISRLALGEKFPYSVFCDKWDREAYMSPEVSDWRKLGKLGMETDLIRDDWFEGVKPLFIYSPPMG